MRNASRPSIINRLLVPIVLMAGIGCSSSPSPSDNTTGGTSGSGGTAANGGTSGSGGSSGGTGGTPAGTGGSKGGSGGSGSNGGTVGNGGTGGSVQSDAGRSDKAADTGVLSDMSPASVDGGVVVGARPPKPSAGCGKSTPTQESRTIMTGGQMAAYNVRLPTGYSATKPMPLGFGFHGFGNPVCGPTSGECQGFAALPAVTVYMKSISDGWEQSPALEQNITFFQDVLTVMKNEYCIDENRIFVAGVSSGGQFVEYLACRFGDSLWQVTPVSASVVDAANKNCKGTPPILVIHGVTDQAGNYGQGVAEMFAKRNGCAATPPAALAKAKTDMMAAFNAKLAQHVCMDWDGCTANPVRFCISSQITYSGLTHGWPKVGGMLIGDFIGMLK